MARCLKQTRQGIVRHGTFPVLGPEALFGLGSGSREVHRRNLLRFRLAFLGSRLPAGICGSSGSGDI
jgi:hypothetical protein